MRASTANQSAIVRVGATLSLIGLLLGAQTGFAATASDVKAVMLLGFAQLSEWNRIPDETPAFKICLLGETELEAALRAAVRDEKAQDREIRVDRVNALADTTDCQIVFVSSNSESAFGEAEAPRSDSGTLFVGEEPDFIRRGGGIEFYSDSGRVRFAIDREEVEGRGIRMSSRILSRARLVGGRR